MIITFAKAMRIYREGILALQKLPLGAIQIEPVGSICI